MKKTQGGRSLLPHVDLTHWVEIIGYVGILSIIFLETGLFLGFFLPGDSLLFTAGFLASQRIFNIWILVPTVFITAILGYQLGYWFGKKFISWLLQRKESFWFKRRYLEQTKAFYDKHGSKALILGRLMPIIRTFVPIVAGMVGMTRGRYLFLNVVGALAWVGGIMLLGYYVGQAIPNAEHYIFPIVLAIIFLSISPGLWRYWHRNSR
ncbi:MAG: hypothetical protein A3F10_06865 [Coxiella sp. RIFCSPHIGHO2_12_FULL_42_15]|nr:MAG: hypothetical protein A3F10_06865 [Coxiella sp. RIFCSPHIGHO2_12_FULL_42_15]